VKPPPSLPLRPLLIQAGSSSWRLAAAPCAQGARRRHSPALPAWPGWPWHWTGGGKESRTGFGEGGRNHGDPEAVRGRRPCRSDPVRYRPRAPSPVPRHFPISSIGGFFGQGEGFLGRALRRNDRKRPLIRPATAGEYACRGPPSEKENTVLDGLPAREPEHGRDGRGTTGEQRASCPCAGMAKMAMARCWTAESD